MEKITFFPKHRLSILCSLKSHMNHKGTRNCYPYFLCKLQLIGKEFIKINKIELLGTKLPRRNNHSSAILESTIIILYYRYIFIKKLNIINNDFRLDSSNYDEEQTFKNYKIITIFIVNPMRVTIMTETCWIIKL